MSRISAIRFPKNKTIPAIAITVGMLAVFGGVGHMALAAGDKAQDKYTLQVPNGLAFSEFRGYEDWQVVAVSKPEENQIIDVILANPKMIKA